MKLDLNAPMPSAVMVVVVGIGVGFVLANTSGRANAEH